MPVTHMTGLQGRPERVRQRDQQVIADRTRYPRLSDGNRVTKSQAAASVVIDAHRQQFHRPRCRRRRAQDELQAPAICLGCSPPATEMYCHSPVSVIGSTRSTRKCGLASRTGPASQMKAATGWPAKKNRLTCSSSAPHVSSHGGKSATAAAYIPTSASRHSPPPVRPRPPSAPHRTACPVRTSAAGGNDFEGLGHVVGGSLRRRWIDRPGSARGFAGADSPGSSWIGLCGSSCRWP